MHFVHAFSTLQRAQAYTLAALQRARSRTSVANQMAADVQVTDRQQAFHSYHWQYLVARRTSEIGKNYNQQHDQQA